MTAGKLDAGNRLAKGECSSVARKPVHTHRCVMKHGGALCCRKIFRESLELVPEHGVRTRKPIDREVAFEHRARWTEVIDRVQIPIPIGGDQFVRCRRFFSLMPTVTVDHHLDTANLGNDVRAARQFGNSRLPRAEYFIAPPGIRSAANGTAQGIEDERRIWKSLSEVRQ